MPSTPCRCVPLLAAIALLSLASAHAQPVTTVDLAKVGIGEGVLHRTFGSRRDGLLTTNGNSGTPVAGGHDVDGDGLRDHALASMKASPAGRTQAGEVFLVFGTGEIRGSLNTAVDQPRLLRVLGGVAHEHAGSEILMADVTGDGLGDLLICRQDYTPSGGPAGVGALSVVVGDPDLRSLAASGGVLDLADPPDEITVFTLTGASLQNRLCIWARTGDVDGDDINDIVVGADQEDGEGPDETDRGALYLLRGGAHLASATRTLSVAAPGAALAGRLVHITPPPGSTDYHLGATCAIADLDGNGRGEVLGAATLARSGASLGPAGLSGDFNGGIPRGAVFILWDDNFTLPWPASLRFEQAPGSRTVIRGSTANVRLGEEILGGLDYDNDGNADLFLGDLIAGPPDRARSGIGHVLYHAATLKNLDFALVPVPTGETASPAGLVTTTFYGPSAGAIAADTGLHGDFNGDGIDDLGFGAPNDSPLGRTGAGTLHLFLGQDGPWPALVDLQPGSHPPPTGVRIIEMYGALGDRGADRGDMVVYSAAAGDMDGDGRVDAIVNEMTGNGVGPDAVDVGNLLILSGVLLERLLSDGFEGGGE